MLFSLILDQAVQIAALGFAALGMDAALGCPWPSARRRSLKRDARGGYGIDVLAVPLLQSRFIMR